MTREMRPAVMIEVYRESMLSGMILRCRTVLGMNCRPLGDDHLAGLVGLADVSRPLGTLDEFLSVDLLSVDPVNDCHGGGGSPGLGNTGAAGRRTPGHQDGGVPVGGWGVPTGIFGCP